MYLALHRSRNLIDTFSQCGPSVPAVYVRQDQHSLERLSDGAFQLCGRLRAQGLDNPFQAARYHSLVIDKDCCPPELEVTAWTEDGTIMAVRHRDYPHVQVTRTPVPGIC